MEPALQQQTVISMLLDHLNMKYLIKLGHDLIEWVIKFQGQIKLSTAIVLQIIILVLLAKIAFTARPIDVEYPIDLITTLVCNE